ncbi:MAG: hypothetical protein E7627_07770 [Ruminococcaceae bacterium]|nr:hypothetical protein [Oscillospiraceae bacterium]
MEIQRHYVFRADEAPDLLKYILDNKIKCKYKYGDVFISFDMYESDPHWEFIHNSYTALNSGRALAETVFSKKELNNAEWLSLRSKWHNGYPQPEESFGYENNITYSNEKLCSKCGAGLKQIGSFRLKKQPNWGNKHFFMLNWVFDELFVDGVGKNILEKEGISGISFLDAKNKRGTEILEDTYQIIIHNRLKPGLITERRSIDDIYVCAECGVPKYHPTGMGMLAFKKEIFDGAPDIVKTAEIFGWGHAAPTEIIVSQKVYQTITKNKLERSLVFEPIELV